MKKTLRSFLLVYSDIAASPRIADIGNPLVTVGADDFIVVDATAGIVISNGTITCAWAIFNL